MVQLTLADLWAVDEGLARGLQSLLDYDESADGAVGTIFDVFGATFTASLNPLVDSYVQDVDSGGEMEGDEHTDEVPNDATEEVTSSNLLMSAEVECESEHAFENARDVLAWHFLTPSTRT